MKEEVLEKIAERVPPGDRWKLIGDGGGEIQPSIIEALSEYCRRTGFMGEYRLAPMQPQTESPNANKGVLYAIKIEEKEVVPKGYNIYGEQI